MSAAAWDPNQFLNQPQTGNLQTKYIRVEPGEYPAVIQKLDYRTLPKKDKPQELSHILDVIYVVDDARQREVTGMAEPTVRQSIFLDIVDGKLDRSTNKNVALGKLLEAVGLNDRAEWTFNDLPGRACFIAVTQTPNEKAPDDPYLNVTKVGKLSR
jgi:hypothetical protein